MPKPPSSVRSIRLPDDVWRQVAEEAEKRGATVNSVMHSFAIVGLFKAAEVRAGAKPEEVCKAQRPGEKPAKKAVAVKAPENAPKVSGYTVTGEPIVAPAFVSRFKAPKKR